MIHALRGSPVNVSPQSRNDSEGESPAVPVPDVTEAGLIPPVPVLAGSINAASSAAATFHALASHVRFSAGTRPSDRLDVAVPEAAVCDRWCVR